MPRLNSRRNPSAESQRNKQEYETHTGTLFHKLRGDKKGDRARGRGHYGGRGDSLGRNGARGRGRYHRGGYINNYQWNRGARHMNQNIWLGMQHNFLQDTQQEQYQHDHRDMYYRNNPQGWNYQPPHQNYTSFERPGEPSNSWCDDHPPDGNFSSDVWNNDAADNKKINDNPILPVPSIFDSSAVSLPKKNQMSKPVTPEEKASKNSHSLELSVKASNIIENILKGEKAPPVKPAEMISSTKSKGDVVEKAENLCRDVRAQRALTRIRQESGPRDRTDSGSSDYQKKVGSVQKSSSMSSNRHMTPVITGTMKTSVASSDMMSVRSFPTRSSHDSPQRGAPRVPKSLSLKDSVMKMLKYPKSRRGTSQIDKLLQKTKVPDASRLRLMHLMKPLAETENQNMEFHELAPDVQEHILSLIDEVMVEINSDDCISLSDDDKSDMTSPQYSSPSHVTDSTSVPQHVAGSRSSTLSVPDISHHFDNLIPQDDNLHELLLPPEDDLNELLGSAGFDNLTDLAQSEFSSQNHQDSIHSFPQSMRKGLRIIDRVISEKNTPCTNKLVPQSDPSHGKQPQMISNVKIKQEKNMNEINKEVDKSYSVSISTPQHLNRPERSDSITHTSEDHRSSASSSHLPHSGINEAQIICIKPEPQDMNCEILIANTFNEPVSEAPATSAPVQRDKDEQKYSIVSENEVEIICMDTDDEDADDDDEMKSVGSKTGYKRPREANIPSEPTQSSPSSSDIMVAKRPKVNDSDNDAGCVTPSVVEELYTISLEEEKVRDKMTEADKSINELLEILEATKTRLQCRQQQRQQLEDKEKALRKRRLKLLKGARNAQRSNSVTSVEHVTSQDDSTTSETKKPKKPKNGKTSTSIAEKSTVKSAKKKPKKKVKGKQIIDDEEVAMEPDTTFMVHPVKDSKVNDLTDYNVQSGNESQQKVSKRRKSLSLSVDISGTVSDSSMVETISRVEAESSVVSQAPTTSQMSLQYLGSFAGEKDVQSVLQHLTKNFKNLKQVSSVALDNGDRLNLNKEINQPVDKLPLSDLAPDTNSRHFKVPETPPPDSMQSSVKTKKASTKKKTKTRSEHQQNEVSGSESDTESSPKVKKNVKKKKKDKATSNVIKEYLYCSSSSDVDIDGLESVASKISNITEQRKSCMFESLDDSDGESEFVILKPKSDATGSKKEKTERLGGLFAEKLPGPITCLAAWRRYIVATGQDYKIKYLIKNKPNDKPHLVVNNHIDQVKVLHISSIQDQANTAYMYSGGMDKTLVITNFKSGIYVAEHQCPAPIMCGAIGWGKIYLGLTNGVIVIFDVQKYRVENTYQAASKDKAVVQIATGQEGTRHILCICEQDQPSITIRDARNKLFIRSLEGHTRTPQVIKIKNHLVYSGGADHMVQIHNIVTGNMESLLRFQSTVTQLIVDGILLVGEKRGVINVIQLKEHVRERVLYTYEKSPVTSMLYDKQHTMLYVGEQTGRLEAIPLATETRKCQFSACTGYSFGQEQHMLHHILIDHVEPCVRGRVHGEGVEQKPTIFKCLWKDCSDYIHIKDSSKISEVSPDMAVFCLKEAKEHISTHVKAEFKSDKDTS